MYLNSDHESSSFLNFQNLRHFKISDLKKSRIFKFLIQVQQFLSWNYMIGKRPWPNYSSAIIWEDFYFPFRTVSPVSTPTGDELKEAFNNQVMCLGNVFDDCKNTGKNDNFIAKTIRFWVEIVLLKNRNQTEIVHLSSWSNSKQNFRAKIVRFWVKIVFLAEKRFWSIRYNASISQL